MFRVGHVPSLEHIFHMFQNNLLDMIHNKILVVDHKLVGMFCMSFSL